MGRKKTAYHCIKKRKRHNFDAMRKAVQARWIVNNKEDLILEPESVSATTSDCTQTQSSGDEMLIASNIEDEESNTCFVIETETATNSKQIGDIISTIVGNRIINFQYFWNQLMTIAEHGENLNCKLNYLRITKEKQVGLISTFELACALCGSKFILKSSENQEQQPKHFLT